jgi:hypothetical protein
MPQAILYARAINNFAGLVEDLFDMWSTLERYHGAFAHDRILYHTYVYSTRHVSVYNPARTSGFEIQFHDRRPVPFL